MGHSSAITTGGCLGARSAAAICELGRIRSVCKDCGGSGICEHSRVTYKYKQWGRGGVCVHGRVKSGCKECKDPQGNLVYSAPYVLAYVSV